MLTQSGRVAAVVVSVAYLTGVLTVGAYLHSLGIGAQDLDFLRTRFVYAGALVLGWLAFTCYVAAFALDLIRSTFRAVEGESRYDAFIREGGILAGPILIGFLWLLDLALVSFSEVVDRGGVSESGTAGDATWLFLSSLLVGAFCWAAWGVYRSRATSRREDATPADGGGEDDEPAAALIVVERPAPPDRTRVVEAPGLLLAGTVAVVLAAAFGWYVTVWARAVYPQLPEHFGGGRPKRAWLAFSNEGAEIAKALDIRMAAPSGTLSAPLDFLFEGKDLFVVRPPNGRIAQIERSIVLGLRFDNHRPRGVDFELVNRGQRGRAEAGDVIALRYSERLLPETVAAGWDGRPLPLRVRIVSNGEGQAVVSFRPQPGGDPIRLGTLELLVDYELPRSTIDFGREGTPSFMTQRGPTIEVVLGTPSGPTPTWSIGGYDDWFPSPGPTDEAGNGLADTTVQHQTPDAPVESRHPSF